MGRLAQKRGVRQFLKFAVVGASGFVVNLAIFTALQKALHDPTSAIVLGTINSIAFLAGGVSNYFLNRAWTFRSTAHVGREGLSFMMVSVLALIVDNIVFAASRPWLGHGHKAWFVATLSAIFVNFFVNKYWTFRSAD
jgi:putative flippase GtrA